MDELLKLFVIFFVLGGGALTVTFIIIKSFLKKSTPKKPFLKWAVVIALSLGQSGCWHLLDKFDSSFGVHGNYDTAIAIFISIVSLWLVYQMVIYYMKQRTPEKQETTDE